MAMTLRLSDAETEALRQRAEFESRSMQDVAKQAVREYVENHSRVDLLTRVLDKELPRYAEALERSATGHELVEAGLPVREDAGRLTLREWLRFGGVGLNELAPWLGLSLPDDPTLAEEVSEDAAYAPYLTRQDNELRDLRAGEGLVLGDAFPYGAIPGLSNEMIERLSAVQPATLAAAGRIPGVTPAALAALLVHARRRAA